MEKFIKKIIVEAGQAVADKFQKIGVKYIKGDATDVVTEADLLANRIITEAIREKYSNHGIISEESDDHCSDAEYVWVIDPLDGTTNFATGVPIFVIMIALVKKRQLEIAAIYDPLRKDLLYTQKGKGTTLNGKKIERNDVQKKLEDSRGIITDNINYQTLKFYQNVLGKIEKCWITDYKCAGYHALSAACGRHDWCLSLRKNMWDESAPALILSEAGYIVTNLEGKPWKFGDKGFVAANKILNKELLNILRAD